MTDLQFGASWSDSATWLGLIKIAAVNLLLSGDNALVLAMATHNLPSRKRRTAIAIGSAAYIVLMLAFTMSIAWLLRLPYLRTVGGAMLCWIGIQSLRPDDRHPAAVSTGADTFAAARTIVLADLAMSLDNALGMAAAANGHLTVLLVALLITAPVVILASARIAELLTRFPLLLVLGAAFIGFIGGELALSDIVARRWLEQASLDQIGAFFPLLTAAVVVALGRLLGRRPEGDRAASSD